MYLKGARLRRLRKNKGLTQAQIAKRLGMSQSTYSHVENAIKPLDCGRLEILAKILDVSSESLLRYSDER